MLAGNAAFTGRAWGRRQRVHRVRFGSPAACTPGASWLTGSVLTGSACAYRQRSYWARLRPPAPLSPGGFGPTGSALTGPAGAHRAARSPGAFWLTGSAWSACADRQRSHWVRLDPPAALSLGPLAPTGSALTRCARAHRQCLARRARLGPPVLSGSPLAGSPRAHHHPSRHPSKNLRTLRRTPGTDTSGATLPTNPLRASADISPAACNCGTIAA